MPSSGWHKTLHPNKLMHSSSSRQHTEAVADTGNGNAQSPPSPFLVLFGICHYNDKAVTDLHQGHLEVAIRMLSLAIESFRTVDTSSSYAKVEARTCTFRDTLPGQASLPHLLEVNHECDDFEDNVEKGSHLFTQAMRLSNSNFPATFTSAWAVVHFNLGLARHIQAVQAKDGSKASLSLLKVAAKSYKASLSPSFVPQAHKSIPKLAKVAALCNLSQCGVEDPQDAGLYRDQYTEAFATLDNDEDRIIFTNSVSSSAMAA